jgi:hypothetical protein
VSFLLNRVSGSCYEASRTGMGQGCRSGTGSGGEGTEGCSISSSQGGFGDTEKQLECFKDDV